MHPLSRRRPWRAAAGLAAAVALLLGASPAAANVTLTTIGSDPFTNSTSQHRTQVEPDTFSYGTTIVSASQTGRFFDGGASDACFATSTNSGGSWTQGCLPGVTKFNGGGIYDRVSDAAVAYDARHNVWMISTLALTDTSGVVGKAVLTSLSTDGGLTWPTVVTTRLATGSANLDKNWIVCDNTSTSAFYGNCYTEYDDNGASNRIHMSVSSNGGTSWTDHTLTQTGLGGQPVVRPNGTVMVPYESNSGQIRSFRSTDGGSTWGSSVTISSAQVHTTAGGLRTSPLPSAEIDAAGTVYVVWQDCRFQSGCAANDIVLSKSTSETTWSTVTRITSDGGDHFIPGIAVNPATSGGSAALAVAYYRYATPSCSASTCQLTVGYTSSANGGTSWSAPTQLDGPFGLSLIANTSQGRMVGDYISVSISGGLAWPVFMHAQTPSGAAFDEHAVTPSTGLPVTGGAIAAVDGPVQVTGGHNLPVNGHKH